MTLPPSDIERIKNNAEGAYTNFNPAPYVKQESIL